MNFDRMAKECVAGMVRASVDVNSSGTLVCLIYPKLAGIFSAVAAGPAIVFARQSNDNPFPHRTATVAAPLLAAFPFRPVGRRRAILLLGSIAGVGDIPNIDFHSFSPLQ